MAKAVEKYVQNRLAISSNVNDILLAYELATITHSDIISYSAYC